MLACCSEHIDSFVDMETKLAVAQLQQGNRRYQTSPALCNRTAHSTSAYCRWTTI